MSYEKMFNTNDFEEQKDIQFLFDNELFTETHINLRMLFSP